MKCCFNASLIGLLCITLLSSIVVTNSIASSKSDCKISDTDYFSKRKKEFKFQYSGLNVNSIRAVYYIGRPSYNVLIKIDNIAMSAASGIGGGPHGMVTAIILDQGIDVGLSILRSIVTNPIQFSRELGAKEMENGIKAMNANYRLYKKGIDKLTTLEKQTFRNNQLQVDILGYAKQLYLVAGEDNHSYSPVDSQLEALDNFSDAILETKAIKGILTLAKITDIFSRNKLELNQYKQLVDYFVKRDKIITQWSCVDSPVTSPILETKQSIIEKNNRFVKLDTKGSILSEGTKKWLAVLDTKTKLTWQSECSKRYSWNSIKQYIDSINYSKYCGFNDWRLPSRLELATILKDTGASYIKRQEGGSILWTSTLNEYSSNCVYHIIYPEGDSGVSDIKKWKNSVVLVRGRSEKKTSTLPSAKLETKPSVKKITNPQEGKKETIKKVHDEHGDTYQTASTIKLNQTVSGVINKKKPYDTDILKVIIKEKGFLKITKRGVPLAVRMKNSKGRLYAASKDGNFSFLDFILINPDTYYVVINPYKNISTGKYTILFDFSKSVTRSTERIKTNASLTYSVNATTNMGWDKSPIKTSVSTRFSKNCNSVWGNSGFQCVWGPFVRNKSLITFSHKESCQTNGVGNLAFALQVGSLNGPSHMIAKHIKDASSTYKSYKIDVADIIPHGETFYVWVAENNNRKTGMFLSNWKIDY